MTEKTQDETRPVGGANLGFDPREDVRGTKGGPGGQKQQWPGDTDAMKPEPDHGEHTYRGSGRLLGRRALVTGGDSGIGRAVAIAFAREGADVAIVYYDEHDDAAETIKWIEHAGRRGIQIAADLRTRDACRNIVKTAVDTFGGLDIVVSNAAFQQEMDLADLDEENLRRTFETNIFATIWLVQAAKAHLEAGASIIITGSVTALDGHARLVDYAATKGALHTTTKSLADAFSGDGVRVNCVAPGPVWTPLIPATLDKAHVERFGADTCWKRPAQPIEIATTYVFLASSDSRYYTGEIFAPTGRGTSR